VEFKIKSRERSWVLVIASVIGLVVILVAGYLIWKSLQVKEVKPKEAAKIKTELPRMANLPPKKEAIPPPPPPSYTPDAPVLEKARQALREGISPEEALALAKSLPDSPEHADAAFLLLEFAADSGNSEAALAVARYYDPTDKEPSGTIRKNPEIAYNWYREALTGGQEKAKDDLGRLRRWVEAQSDEGSHEARQLLKNWR
jgi:cytoskeletal protein RodZ